jgi:hypothetical protein
VGRARRYILAQYQNLQPKNFPSGANPPLPRGTHLEEFATT